MTGRVRYSSLIAGPASTALKTQAQTLTKMTGFRNVGTQAGSTMQVTVVIHTAPSHQNAGTVIISSKYTRTTINIDTTAVPPQTMSKCIYTVKSALRIEIFLLLDTRHVWSSLLLVVFRLGFDMLRARSRRVRIHQSHLRRRRGSACTYDARRWFRRTHRPLELARWLKERRVRIDDGISADFAIVSDPSRKGLLESIVSTLMEGCVACVRIGERRELGPP